MFSFAKSELSEEPQRSVLSNDKDRWHWGVPWDLRIPVVSTSSVHTHGHSTTCSQRRVTSPSSQDSDLGLNSCPPSIFTWRPQSAMRGHAEKPHSPLLPFDPPQKAQVSSLYRRLIPGISGIKISFLSKLVYKMMLAMFKNSVSKWHTAETQQCNCPGEKRFTAYSKGKGRLRTELPFSRVICPDSHVLLSHGPWLWGTAAQFLYCRTIGMRRQTSPSNQSQDPLHEWRLLRCTGKVATFCLRAETASQGPATPASPSQSRKLTSAFHWAPRSPA